MLATPDGMCFINTTGSIALATAGSGDILAGYIAGHLAQGKSMVEACQRALCLHGYAGDLLLKTHGGRGAIGRDILEKLAHIEVEHERLMDEIFNDMSNLKDLDEDFDTEDPLGLHDLDEDPLGLDFLNNPN